MLKKLIPLALGGLISLCLTSQSQAAVESANFPRWKDSRCSDVHERGGVWTPSKGPLVLSGSGSVDIEFYGDGIDYLAASEFRLNGQIVGNAAARDGHNGPDNAVSGCGGIGSRVVTITFNGSATRQTGNLRIGTDTIPLTLVPGYAFKQDWSPDNEPTVRPAITPSPLTDAEKRAHDAPLIAQAVNNCLTDMATRQPVDPNVTSYQIAHIADCSPGYGYLHEESAGQACSQINAHGYSCAPVQIGTASGHRRIATFGSCISRLGGSAHLSADTLTLIIPANSSSSNLSSCSTRANYLSFRAVPTVLNGVHFVGNAAPVIGMQISPSAGAPSLSYTQNNNEDEEGGYLNFTAASLRNLVGVYTYTIRPSGERSRPFTLVLMSDPANAVKTLSTPLYPGGRMSSTARFRASLFQAARQGQSFDVALTSSDVSGCFEQSRIQITPPVGATSFDVDFKYTEATGCVGKSVSFVATAVGYRGLEATATFTIPPLEASQNLPPSSPVTKVRSSVLNQN